jgi:protein CpxP
MNKRLLTAAGLAVILGGTTAVTLAQPPGGPGAGRRWRAESGRLGDFGLRGIDLTDAQRNQVQTILQSHQEARRAAHTKLREAHRGLAEATRVEVIDEAAVRARSADVATAMADEAILRARIRAEVHGILTAEQQATLKERSAQMEQRRQERPKRRPQQ